MFRIAVITAAVCALCVGCSTVGKIQMRVDDMTGSKVITLDLEHTSKEKMPGLLSPRYDCLTKYAREIKPTNSEVIRVTLVTRTCVECDDITDNAIVKANDEKFEIKLVDRVVEVKTEISSTTETTHQARADGFVDYSKPGNSKTTTSSQSWKEMRGKIAITPEMKKSLLAANTITYRIYSGTNPITFDLKPEDVVKVKKLLLTDGSDIK
ncbi:MAG: hypothetical protein EPN93_04160 [Spirochaetes bacterium]|nr:MAG: hypothetical protein EPN93_04160 [Spirochaetota bacterium]